MSTVLRIADVFRQILVPFLIAAAALFVILLVGLIVQRLIRSALDRRRQARVARFEPLVDLVLTDQATESDRQHLLRFGQRSPMLLGQMIVTPLVSMSGAPVTLGAGLAAAAGVTRYWHRDVSHRQWWRRAEALRSLGVIGDPTVIDALVSALDDPHEEVRAAAVEGLGRLGDLRAVPELLKRLPEQSRHQRVRIISALDSLGVAAGPMLLAFLAGHPDVLPFVVDLVPAICGSDAAEPLLALLDHPAADVRAAALAALGTIGIDDNAYYYVLKSLAAEDPRVRAMAARALGRSGRDEAASYLADHLADDDWTVAAETARALVRLHDPGRAVLAACADGESPAAHLARQALWEQQSRVPGAAGAR